MRSIIVLLLLAFTSSVPAAPPAEEGKAYALRVELLFKPNPRFDDAFRGNLAADIARQVRGTLGSRANTEVVDVTAKLEKERTELESALLARGPAAFDGRAELDGAKTHAFWIESTADGFRIRSRQFDGDTGFATPLRDTTVADLAGILPKIVDGMQRDFGFVGSFDPAGDKVTVAWKAGRAGEALNDWIVPGDVLRVVQIFREANGKLRAATADCDDVLLQVESPIKDGKATCKLIRQYADPLPRPRGNFLGYRCIRLATADVPVRVKLVDPKGQPLRQASLQVRIRDGSFPEAFVEREVAVPRDGLFVSRDSISNLAFIRVDLGERAVARIPVAVTGDGVVTRVVNLEPGAEDRARLEGRRKDWLTRQNDSRRVQNECYKELEKRMKKGDTEAAAKLATATMIRLDGDIIDLGAELTRLREQAAELKLDAKALFDPLNARLESLTEARKTLEANLFGINDVLRQENLPEVKERRKQVLAVIARVDLARKQGDIEDAIKLYNEAIGLSKEDAKATEELTKARDELTKAWEVKDTAHAAARQYIYNQWTKSANFEEMKTRLPEARKAFETLKGLNDTFALVKINQSSPDLENLLAEEGERLLAAAKDDATLKRLEALNQFKNDLIAFHNEVAAALRR